MDVMAQLQAVQRVQRERVLLNAIAEALGQREGRTYRWQTCDAVTGWEFIPVEGGGGWYYLYTEVHRDHPESEVPRLVQACVAMNPGIDRAQRPQPRTGRPPEDRGPWSTERT